MAKKQSSSTTARKSSVRPARAKTGSLKPAWKAAVPPPDDPMLRHRETEADIRIVTERPSRAPAAAALDLRRAGRGVAARVVHAGAPVAQRAALAAQRVDALHVARRMFSREAGGPVLARAVVGRAPDSGAPAPPPPVPPMTGVSNWVAIGPTAIPKGQNLRWPARPRHGARHVDCGRPDRSQHPLCWNSARWRLEVDRRGTRWTPISDNEASLAVGAVAMDPSNHLTIYVGTGEGNFSGDSYYGAGVLKSVDGGATWTTLGASTFVGTRFSRLAVTPGTPARLFGATGFGLFRSVNAAVAWSAMTSGLPAGAAATDVAIDPATPTTVYAGFWNRGIYKSTNAAAATPTWTQLAGGLPAAGAASPNGFTRVALAISPSSPQTLYALLANNDTTSPAPGPPFRYAVDKLYRSTNGGTSWTAIPLPGGAGNGIGGQGFYNLNVAVDPTTPDVIFLSGSRCGRACGIPERVCGRSPTSAARSIQTITRWHSIRPITSCSTPDPMVASIARAMVAPRGATALRGTVHHAVRVHRSTSHIGCRRARRHAGQRHRAVSEQPGLLSRGRRRRRILRDRSGDARQ